MKNNTRARLNVIQPQPFRTLDQDDDDSGAVRRHDCRSYDRCNHVAIVLGWPGFTCRECPAFAEQVTEAKQRDAHASIRAAAEILGFRTEEQANDDDQTASIAEIKWAA